MSRTPKGLNRKYELIVIFHPHCSDQQLKQEIERLEGSLKEHQAENIQVISWGRREIAYQLNKHKYGTYYYITFSTTNHNLITELTSLLRINDNLLKFQFHRIIGKRRKVRARTRSNIMQQQQEAV